MTQFAVLLGLFAIVIIIVMIRGDYLDQLFEAEALDQEREAQGVDAPADGIHTTREAHDRRTTDRAPSPAGGEGAFGGVDYLCHGDE